IRDRTVTGVQTCALPICLDALDLADRLPLPLHVLVTDYHLPLMDGAVLAQTWRLHRPNAHILLFSGDLPPVGRPGQFHFLKKPRSEERRVGKELRSRWRA